MGFRQMKKAFFRAPFSPFEGQFGAAAAPDLTEPSAPEMSGRNQYLRAALPRFGRAPRQQDEV